MLELKLLSLDPGNLSIFSSSWQKAKHLEITCSYSVSKTWGLSSGTPFQDYLIVFEIFLAPLLEYDFFFHWKFRLGRFYTCYLLLPTSEVVWVCLLFKGHHLHLVIILNISPRLELGHWESRKGKSVMDEIGGKREWGETGQVGNILARCFSAQRCVKQSGQEQINLLTEQDPIKDF